MVQKFHILISIANSLQRIYQFILPTHVWGGCPHFPWHDKPSDFFTFSHLIWYSFNFLLLRIKISCFTYLRAIFSVYSLFISFDHFSVRLLMFLELIFRNTFFFDCGYFIVVYNNSKTDFTTSYWHYGFLGILLYPTI